MAKFMCKQRYNFSKIELKKPGVLAHYAGRAAILLTAYASQRSLKILKLMVMKHEGDIGGGTQNRDTANKIGKNRNTASKIDRIPKPHFEMPDYCLP